MIEEISAGGIVFFKNSILMLRKFNGDWVLPKGRVEDNESLKETAMREVYEETKAKVIPIKYLGKISYEFSRTCYVDKIHIKKEVHWYLMIARNMNCTAQKNEGFVEAKFLHFEKSLEIARYDDERKIIKKAIDEIKFRSYE
ncbi:MAG TPA: NUDIX hydrolase [Sedimentibacter sp.]|jgi:8-oxo-dGTP pyrophosphatase MutT (NUDIX family)|nr:NUDIX hydrolase [Sedimentibacter sp.]HNZ83376.1 NUDIX hydrolase [Sedimentibacter sp.]HOH70129.1 NUDIX hydrolase [Sedimentibacter sp.]HPW99862.1 NUDIX hydrolase [Sedimentibacter sp.]HQB64075.1 NUDIX hydrolase [Sedimentibacter sp.]